MYKKAIIKSILILCTFIIFGAANAWEVPEGLEFFAGEDGSVWERVNQPGFGSDNNMSVVATAEYGERLYAMTRNEIEGVEVWRSSGTGWEQVLFPGGETNGIYGNSWINNVWGDMMVFQGKLYFGFSSGLQGTVLKSTGCEIWRYDGTNWEAVISDKKDTEVSGNITLISGCASGDGNTTAEIADNTKSWYLDQWAGGVLQITSGDGEYRRFDIISNTADTLTIQQNEVAGNVGSEYTICGSQHYNNPFPPYEYDLGEVQVGDSYEIGTGYDENGFGDYWNKTITDMTIFDNEMYVSTGLNYEYGAQVWHTADGDNWTVTNPHNSFGNFHPDSNYPNAQKPVSTSIPSLSPSSVSGTEILYAGGTGSTGDLGKCSRIAKLTATGWELIVDVNVDANDEGTNENGFGDGMDCDMFTGNFMPWSITSFSSKLHAGINSLGGARVLYTENGSSEDGNWFYSVGGDSGIPNGFDGIVNGGFPDSFQNIAVNLFPFGNYLYGGIVATYSPALGSTEEYLTGSHIWKSIDGIDWQQVTGNGFGDDYIINFEGFTTFADVLYVAGSKGASSSTEGLGGAKIFRLFPVTPEDIDGDGVSNSMDNCPETANGLNLGTCTAGNMGNPCMNNGDCGYGGFCSMSQEDSDGDGLGDSCDNCPETPNGPGGGTCTEGTNSGDPCATAGDNTSECGDNGFCSMDQEDTDGDEIGDACDAFPHSYPPLPEALDAMVSDSVVTVKKVEVEEWEENSNFYYSFEPNNADPTVGFIIYPGGLLDPRAYAPPAHTIASEGYLTVIVKVEEDLAIKSPRRADRIINDYSGIEKWIIGGHSLGGSVACAYAKEYTYKVDGVVLWASFPSEAFRIDGTGLKAISIYGTNDGEVEAIEASGEHLPPDTQWTVIEGGNHTQFGWYDTSPHSQQPGDNPADITREEQQEQIIQATLDFLMTFTGGIDVTLTPGDIFCTPGQTNACKKPICLDNPEVLVGGIQFDLCEYDPFGNPIDCMACIDCELTERTTMFDCAVLELPNGCCRVILFCKNPGCAINPGLCDVVTIVYEMFEISEECPGTTCIVQIPENIVASDYEGYELTTSGLPGMVCPFVCGDVCPPDDPLTPGWDCGDNLVDIYDIMCEVDFALTSETPDDCQTMRADVPTGTPPDCTTPDASIDILDIMVLIDMALNRQDCCSFYYMGVIY